MRILVVDDDSLAYEITAAVLEGLNHQCLPAENGVEALQQLAADASIELVISDMHMPLIDGVELLREMREQGLQTPFILLTGDDPEDIRRRVPEIDACLLKDFTLEESLPPVIEEAMARYKTPV